MTIEKDKYCKAYGGGQFKIMDIDPPAGEIKRVKVDNTWYSRNEFCQRFYMVIDFIWGAKE